MRTFKCQLCGLIKQLDTVFNYEVCPRCVGNMFPIDYVAPIDWKSRAEKAESRAKTAESRVAELEAENDRLSKILHDKTAQFEIATDLSNKQWIALNEIYENGEKHNVNWCKRKAQEGLTK